VHNLSSSVPVLDAQFSYTSLVTEKCNVYSFGVVVLEVLLPCWANIQETCKQITFHCATNQFLPEEVLNKQLPRPKTEEAKDVRRIPVALDCLLPSPKEKANYGERLSRS
jgi:hypothetical protein